MSPKRARGLLLRATGWDVVGVARRAGRLEALDAEVGSASFAADLTNEADVQALAAHLADTGSVDALVHIAGGARGVDRVEDGSVADWRWMFEVNVVSAQLVTAALLLWCRGHADSAALSMVLLVISIIDLGAIVPIWIVLYNRLKEIEGGEEDAAAEY